MKQIQRKRVAIRSTRIEYVLSLYASSSLTLYRIYILIFLFGFKAYFFATKNGDEDLTDHLFYTIIIIAIRTLRFVLQIIAIVCKTLYKIFRKKRYRGRIELNQEEYIQIVSPDSPRMGVGPLRIGSRIKEPETPKF